MGIREGKKEYDKIYVHYGSPHFDINRFKAAKNLAYWQKPNYGLWGSPVESTNSWKNWCHENEFERCTESNCFYFRVQNWQVYKISCRKDLDSLPLISPNEEERENWNDVYLIDYEALIRENVFAIEIIFNEVRDQLRYFDCDSIIILEAYNLVENYDARTNNNPLTYNKLCPYRWFKTILGDVEVSCSTQMPNGQIFVYCEQPDRYFGFKTLLACISDGRIVETCGYSEDEARTIIQEVMRDKHQIISLVETSKIK